MTPLELQGAQANMARLVSLTHALLLLSVPCRYGSENSPGLRHQQVSHHSICLVFVFPLSLLPSFFLLKLFLQEVTLTASPRILKIERSAKGLGMCYHLSGFFSSHKALINLTRITWVFVIDNYYFRSEPSLFSGAQPFKVAFLLDTILSLCFAGLQEAECAHRATFLSKVRLVGVWWPGVVTIT
jgi:hypothetical protein